MISGPISMRLIREFLGKKEAEMERLIKEDGFPVQETWSASKPIQKVFFHPLLTWLNKGAINAAWTADTLEAELSRAQKAIEKRDALKREAKEAREALATAAV